MWRQTAAALLDRPWFGHGQGQFRYQVPAALGIYNHPHNSMLQFAYDWGLVGVGALAAAITPLIQSFARKNGRDLRTALPAVGGVSGLGIMSLVEGSFYHAFPLMISVLCMAVAATTDPCFRTRSAKGEDRFPQAAVHHAESDPACSALRTSADQFGA